MSHTFVLPFVNAFRRTKGANYALPSDWPSPWFNKCSSLRCYYPNFPQPAVGIYQCRGKPEGRPCVGTYYVPAAQARHVMEEHKKWLEEDERRREKQAGKAQSSKSRAGKGKSTPPTPPEKDEKYRPALRKVKASRDLTGTAKRDVSAPQTPPPPPPPTEKKTPFVHRQVKRPVKTSAGDSTPSLLENAHVHINATIVGGNPSAVSLMIGSRPQPPPAYTTHPVPHSDPKSFRPPLAVQPSERPRPLQSSRGRI